AGREPVARLALAAELVGDHGARLAGAQERACQDGVRPDSLSGKPLAECAGLVAALGREPAELVGVAGCGVGVADEEELHLLRRARAPGTRAAARRCTRRRAG